MTLAGKNAVVTGSARGIGKAIVEKLAASGANVFACARKETIEHENYCSNLANKYGVNIIPIYFDLANTEAMKLAVKKMRTDSKCIDILINNAGVSPENHTFLMTTATEMQHVFQINFFATMELTRMLSKVMLRQKSGSIVNISSIAAIDGEPAQLEYVASKAALTGATKKLAQELAVYGIRVNAVAPGVTKTDMINNMKAEVQEKFKNATLLKRFASPAEIANAVCFLASDEASFITGQTLRVDGGLTRIGV